MILYSLSRASVRPASTACRETSKISAIKHAFAQEFPYKSQMPKQIV
jgi:hypothetical protein